MKNQSAEFTEQEKAALLTIAAHMQQMEPQCNASYYLVKDTVTGHTCAVLVTSDAQLGELLRRVVMEGPEVLAGKEPARETVQ